MSNINCNKIPHPLFLIGLVVMAMLLSSCSCSKKKQSAKGSDENETISIFDFDANYGKKKVGVLYFSTTGNTKIVAEKIATIFNTTALAIEPKIPYTKEDLDYTNKNSRSYLENEIDVFNVVEESIDDVSYTISIEQRSPKEMMDRIIEIEKERYGDGYETISKEEEEKIKKEVLAETDKRMIIDTKNRRTNNGKVTAPMPEIKDIDVNKYEVIFVGYPIWYGQAPKVMYTFIKDKDLEGKTIIPFCTSGSSDIADSDDNLANYASEKVYFMSGKRFTKNSSSDEIKDWIIKLGADLDVR